MRLTGIEPALLAEREPKSREIVWEQRGVRTTVGFITDDFQYLSSILSNEHVAAEWD